MIKNDVKSQLKVVALGMCASFALSGCSFISSEKEINNSISIQAYNPVVYDYCLVEKDDLQNSAIIKLEYKSASKTNLKFDLQSYTVNQCFVNKGDYVEIGQLIAEVECDNIKDSISKQEENIKMYENNIEYFNKLKDSETSEDKIKDIEQNIVDNQRNLDVSNQYISQYNSELTKYQLRSPSSGIVTYLNTQASFSPSTSNITYATIENGNKLFVGSIKEDIDLEALDEVSVLVDDNSYLGTVLSLNTSENETYIEVEMGEDVSFKDGVIGTININKEQLTGALHIKASAVFVSSGKEYVYRINDLGYKEPVEVKTGLKIGNELEIIDGLDEGDKIAVN